MERDRSSPADAQPHPAVAVVAEGVRRYGPGVYGRLGIDPAQDLRYAMHVLFMRFLDGRSEGRLPDFAHRNLDRLKAEFLDTLRAEIVGLAKQVLEPVPPRVPPAAGRRTPGLPRRAQRPRGWR